MTSKSVEREDILTLARDFKAFLKTCLPHQNSFSNFDQEKLRNIYNLQFKHNTNSAQKYLPLVPFKTVFEMMSKELENELDFDTLDLNFKSKQKVDVEETEIEDFKSVQIGVLDYDDINDKDILDMQLSRDKKHATVLCALNAPSASIEDKHYRVFRDNLPERLGGILVYVRKELGAKLIPQFRTTLCQGIWIELCIKSCQTNITKTVVVGNLHRKSSVSTDVDFVNYVRTCITQVRDQNPKAEILIQGSYFWPEMSQIPTRISLKDDLDMHSKCATLKEDMRITYLRSNGLKDELFLLENNMTPILSTNMELHDCILCKESFIGQTAHENHRRSSKHRVNFFHYEYNNHREEWLKPKLGLMFEYSSHPEEYDGQGITYAVSDCTQGKLIVFSSPPASLSIPLKIRNTSNTAVVLNRIVAIDTSGNVTLKDKYEVTKDIEDRGDRLKPGVKIPPKIALSFTLNCQKNDVSQYKIPIVAFARACSNTSHHSSDVSFCPMILEVIIKVQDPYLKDLDAYQSFDYKKSLKTKWRDLRLQLPADESYRRSMKPELSGPPQKVGLPKFSISEELRNIFKFGKKNPQRLSPGEQELKRHYDRLLKEGLRVNNYEQFFHFLLWSEERQEEIDIRSFDMKDAPITQGKGKYFLVVPGLAEKRPSVLRGDRILVQESTGHGPAYQGNVEDVMELKVELKFSENFKRSFIKGQKFNIQFTVNRFPAMNSHRAVDQVRDDPKMMAFLFPEDPKLCGKPLPRDVNFINRYIEGNKAQASAVTNILSGNLLGAPYIIFGPPGTGKTMTVCETIKQIYRRDNKNCCILACAPSNSASDLIAARILETVSPSDVLRYYAPSRDERQVPEKLKPVSSLGRTFVTVNDFLKYKVIVVTLVTAGRLVTMGLPSGYFSHIFLDECGHAMEPESLIPISGLCDLAKTQVILAGDPRQLGPIVRSPIAMENGLQISILERLMTKGNFNIYKKDSEGNFNSSFIVKLLDNYRSHEGILKLPSKLFYENELRASSDPIITSSMLGFDDGLSEAPMIFHSVAGEDKREEQSPSFFNLAEVHVVVDYLRKLLCQSRFKTSPNDIGVITPYRRQVKKIRDYMNHKFQSDPPCKDWNKVTIGSTEEFQGQERKVIIISTVRSREQFIQADIEHKLGFLKNPKRFNVAITRAKALMIVVGNPLLLARDSNWNQLIKHIQQHGCFRGTDNLNLDNVEPLDIQSLEERFEQLDIHAGTVSPDLDFEFISEKEVQEAPQWRTDF